MPDLVSTKYGVLHAPILTMERKKRVNAECLQNALETLRDYKHWSLIKEDDHAKIKRQIKSAKTNDEISGIMCRLRHRIYR